MNTEDLADDKTRNLGIPSGILSRIHSHFFTSLRRAVVLSGWVFAVVC